MLVVVLLCAVAFVGARTCDRSTSIPSPPAARLQTVVRRAPVTGGSLAGAIRDDGGAIAGAIVCALDASVLGAAPCVTSDAQGRYRMAALVHARYTVHVSAEAHRPTRAAIDVTGDATLDVELRRGGAVLSGVGSDLSGGPIARARVRAGAALVETADDGTFTAWVPPGEVKLLVAADGYAPRTSIVMAPRHVAIALIPEGVITGIVIDANTKRPVAGVRVTPSVEVDDDMSSVTDEHGRFRVTHLPPNAIEVIATSPTGYGRSTGSVMVDVGTTTDIVIELHPAVTVTGHVMLEKAACAPASVTLRDAAKDRRFTLAARGDVVVAEGVLPGTYDVEVEYSTGVARSYPPLVVGRDHVEATWEVDRGARIEGRVSYRSGVPREGEAIAARAMTGRAWRGGQTDETGRYVITGVRPGPTRMVARHERLDVDVPPGGLVRDFVIDDVGTVRGTVRDEAGAPVADYHVDAAREAGRGGSTRTDARGAYRIDDVQPDAYTLTVLDSQRNDIGRAPITVRANEVAVADLVVKRPAGKIAGVVVDDAGRAVGDAFVQIVRERDEFPAAVERALTGSAAKTMTGVDGTFTIRDVPPGAYTVHAFRSARGEATVEHVAPGAQLRLQLPASGSISGTVRSWTSSLEDMMIDVENRAVGYSRSERFFRTNGAFTIGELPAGRYTIVAGAEGQQTRLEVEFADGERRQGIEIALVPLVTVTGRVIDHRSKQPVAGIEVSVMNHDSTRFVGAHAELTDANGRFTITRMPLGPVVALCRGRGFKETYAKRTVAGRSPIDVGDLLVMRSFDDPSGESGLLLAYAKTFAYDERATVEAVTPGSPAARAGIVAGDIITSIDGVDTAGIGIANAFNALVAPPGTKLTIVLARGVTVEIVLVP